MVGQIIALASIAASKYCVAILIKELYKLMKKISRASYKKPVINDDDECLARLR